MNNPQLFRRAVLTVMIFAAPLAMAASSSGEEKDQGSPQKSESAACEVKWINPHSAPEPHSPRAEAPDVIKAVDVLVQACAAGNSEVVGKLIDDQCSVSGADAGKTYIGKKAVMEHLQQAGGKHTAKGSEPLISFTLNQPFIKVIGASAVVTFKATCGFGGKSPRQADRSYTLVFAKDADDWKLVHEQDQPVLAGM